MIQIELRPAQQCDVPAIVQLVSSYAAQAVMLPRTSESVSLGLDDFIVAVDKTGALVACGSLKEYSPSVAEVASLAVAREMHGKGLGKQMVSAIENLAAKRGIEELFALTTTPAFFESFGYTVAERARYPEKIRRDCFSCPRRIKCSEVCVSKVITQTLAVAA